MPLSQRQQHVLRSQLSASILLLWIGLFLHGTAMATVADDTLYLDTVKPVLTARCYACHGALKQESDFRVDTVSAMVDAGMVDPENPNSSLLLERVMATDEHDRMPPEGAALTNEQVDAISLWIEQGAVAPADDSPEPTPEDHWAFVRPLKKPTPDLSGRSNTHHPIDAWFREQHERRGITAASEADRRVLIRRLYVDLVGLPPTPEQVSRFLNDQRPDAYERLVEHLLATPQYGERWGRHWMDVWRYSDWYGLGAQLRHSQKHIWHWRDWIVESLNEDAGYDDMVRAMLAADELTPTDNDSLRATGFLARNYFLFNRTTWLDSTIEHTSKAFLGLTMNCAKCHDHKYDPISQVDYYRMRAVFEPHHVRLDPLPSTMNLIEDGLPRAYDLHLDRPTHLHIRGDAKQPDTTTAISPGIPLFLEQCPLSIEEVELPRLAHRPDLRPYVQSSRLRVAEKDVASAQTQVANSQQTLADIVAAEEQGQAFSWQQFADAPADNAWLLDDFQSHDPSVWRVADGEWSFGDQGATQSRVGASRAFCQTIQEPPGDFVASLRFTTHGGDQWKSVGLGFDATETHDAMVYMSAVKPGSKVQVTFGDNGTYTYPAEGRNDRAVNTDQPYELGVAVVDRLVNVFIDGEFILAYSLPIERQPGAFNLVAFDANVTFHSLRIDPLPKGTRLATADGALLTSDEAEQAVAIAKAEWQMKKSYLQALRASYLAEQPLLETISITGDEAEVHPQDNVLEAARAFRQWKTDQAYVAVLKAKLDVSQNLNDEAKQKALTQATKELEILEAKLDEPGTERLQLRSSEKALDGPGDSGASLTAPFPERSSGRRTAFAEWVVDDSNPLTARVAVNHIWMRHFGRPLVESVFDFGRRAETPPMANLLDWLAVDFVEHGWSMKHLHRLIVTSAAYKMESRRSDALNENLSADATNDFYWVRFPIRMESQAIRDSLRSLSGSLSLQQGGRSIRIDQDTFPYRRAIYFEHSRDSQDLFLSTFDDADILRCYRREESVIPQQALALANSKVAMESARAIVDQLIASGVEADSNSFAPQAYEYILGVQPNEQERELCVNSFESMQELAKKLGHADASRRAAETLVLAILNSNDFVTIR